MYNKIPIKEIIPGSIAEEIGIAPGDVLVNINGFVIMDVFDYRYYINDDYFEMEVEKVNGEIWELEIEKEPEEDLGLVFEEPLMDNQKSCMNKCIFCFIDQLPENMRETLYFKDDDARLSFLFGNYITLTNLKEDDLDRIINYRMSPINISVHTTNPELRIMMLNNRFAGNILLRIHKLIRSGIKVNAQIVLCRDVNDGIELDKTLKDLTAVYPGIQSISVVPLGLTRYREGLFKMEPHDSESAQKIIEQVEEWQRQLLEEKGSRVVYLADEFYLTGNREIPEYSEYEDFPQLENGVGMIRLFIDEFNKELSENKSVPINKSVSIATGVSVYPYIQKLSCNMEKRFPGLKIYVYPIKNDFFGENITVTGLLTGHDIMSQLKGNPLGDKLLLSGSMFKSDKDIFLDDIGIDELGEFLNIRVEKVPCDGSQFVKHVLS